MVAKKDVNMSKHPKLADKNAPNLHVIKVSQVTRLLRSSLPGDNFYWYLTNKELNRRGLRLRGQVRAGGKRKRERSGRSEERGFGAEIRKPGGGRERDPGPWRGRRGSCRLTRLDPLFFFRAAEAPLARAGAQGAPPFSALPFRGLRCPATPGTTRQAAGVLGAAPRDAPSCLGPRLGRGGFAAAPPGSPPSHGSSPSGVCCARELGRPSLPFSADGCPPGPASGFAHLQLWLTWDPELPSIRALTGFGGHHENLVPTDAKEKILNPKLINPGHLKEFPPFFNLSKEA
ncbi:40S ribosomal protein S10-1-like [Myotis lucifugus]|uniref:40S ribosomal protein S10-1-like n=1 Tax=Myotis lucifugus TaxID=59463 RepID=UPI000CCC4B6D|nr:40S ribosomal protein S10-1-like [Myotis lucifugus]